MLTRLNQSNCLKLFMEMGGGKLFEKQLFQIASVQNNSTSTTVLT